MSDISLEPNPERSDEFIKLTVVGIVNSIQETHFNVKFSTNICKIKQEFQEKHGIPTSQLCFIFGGRRINDEETPKDLEMKDDDVIKAYIYGAPKPEGCGEYIKLKVIQFTKVQENNELDFKLKFSTNLGKLIKSYSDRKGIPSTSFGFIFGWRRIIDGDTPKSLEMKDGDIIEVVCIKIMTMYQNKPMKPIGGDEYIIVKIRYLNGEEHVKVNFSTNMGKLIKSFGDRKDIPIESLRFIFGFLRIRDEDTPKALEMKDGDTIEVYQLIDHSLKNPSDIIWL